MLPNVRGNTTSEGYWCRPLSRNYAWLMSAVWNPYYKILHLQGSINSVSDSVNASKWAPHPFPASASTFCTGTFDADADANANAHCK